MSRIGKVPVKIPDGVEVMIDGSKVRVKGPKGELIREFSSDMSIKKEEKQVRVERPTDSGTHRSLHGLTRSLLNNMVVGVSEGFEKQLDIVGVGYRANKKGKGLELQLGFSHPVVVEEPTGITLEAPQQTRIIVKGADKEQVGKVAAEIRALRGPEPYKGKGIRYVDERVRKKAGKVVA